jgi:hypothetical protein
MKAKTLRVARIKAWRSSKKRVKIIDADFKAGVFHEYANHLQRLNKGEKVNCFCVRGDMVEKN